MRLTLRTLLAYLDDTLEPQDAEILRQKVEQSGFATQLVQRIRGSLSDPSLSAPAPDSVHPIEEPNMMSNYLDSTLSPEQIAEIEKACLESLPHLAEAAACHQILTMVLGRPADVSDSLRERIHGMVTETGEIVVSETSPAAGQLGSTSSPAIAGEIGPRYSGVEVPADDRDGGQVPIDESSAPPVSNVPDADVQPQSIVDPRDAALQDVQPVGVDDSGVFQAATKLREQSHQFADPGTALDSAEPLAGLQPKKGLDRSDFLEGKTRAPRITPWLISIALVAILIFAISQIFAPLFGPQIASNEQAEKAAPSSTDETVEEEDGEATDADQSESDTGEASNEANGNETSEDAAVERETGTEDKSASSENDPQPDDAELASESTSPVPAPDEGDSEGESNPEGEAAPTADVAMANEDAPPIPPGLQPEVAEPEMTVEDSDGPPVPPEVPDERIAALPDKKADGPAEMAPETKQGDIPVAAPDDDPGASSAAAIFTSKDALLGTRGGEGDWKLVAADAEMTMGQTIVCAPEYRAEFAIGGETGTVLTLVGPTEIKWIGGDQTVNIRVVHGRGLIKFGQPGTSASLAVGESILVASTESADAVLAFDVSYFRELGSDPLVPQNHVATIEVSSVSGDISVTGDGGTIDLPAGSQAKQEASKAFSGKGIVVAPPQLPPWIDPEIDTGSLESEAASALLELVRSDESESLLLSLRVALGFRRGEVAALAGKSMLAMGDASAYFGVDGLFSAPKQRLYWESHLKSMRAMMARSVEDSASVRTAIAGENDAMDVVEGDTLFRLLTGYSQDQLKTGGDAELVADLESRSMPVRVLASEHLRDIYGSTLYFKPEEEIASRREEYIKKWKALLRREAIRYPEPE